MGDESKAVMKIGVLSDTHIPHAALRIPAQVLRGLEGADMILHAGDLACLEVVQELGRIAPVFAVCGNMDPPEVRAELPLSRMVEVGGYRIGIVHGRGAPFGLADRAESEFHDAEGAKVDIVIFVHCDSSCEDWRGGILRFNPGSPTDRRFTRHRSYGILMLGETIESSIIRL